MRKILLAAILMLGGCDEDEAPRRSNTLKDFSQGWSMSTVDYDGHKFIVGTYGNYRTYHGAMVHHPGCPCLKASK